MTDAYDLVELAVWRHWLEHGCGMPTQDIASIVMAPAEVVGRWLSKDQGRLAIDPLTGWKPSETWIRAVLQGSERKP